MPQPDTGQEPLLRIAAELRDVTVRLAGVVDLLTGYATTEQHRPAPPPPPKPAPPPQPPPIPALAPEPVPTSQAAPLVRDWDQLSLPPDDPADSETWTWDRFGGRMLAWVGGTVTILGVVLLLVLAIQRGWLGPAPRLVCGACIAAVLLAAAARVHRVQGGQIGAFALAATGFAALYADVVAATVLYHYLPAMVGLLAALVVAGAGLLLADRWVSLSLAMFVVLAAAGSAPLVTQAVTPLLVAFLLVLASAATPVQLRRNWRYLAIAAEGPPLVAVLILERFASLTGTDVPATVAVTFVTTLAYLVLATGTVLRDPDNPIAVGLLVVAPVPVMAAGAVLSKVPAVASLAVLTAMLFGIWAVNVVTKRLPLQFATAAGAAGAVTLCQATVIATVADNATLSITLLCQSMLFAVVARQTRGPGTLVVGACYGAVGTAVALAGPTRLTLLLVAPVDRHPTSTLATAALVAALILLATVVMGLMAVHVPVPRSPGRWTVLGIVALYGFSTAVLCTVMLAAPDAAGFRIGHLVITVCWTVCALALLARGINALPARITGLSLFGAAVLKLFTFDLVQLDGIIRAGTFLCVGVVLLIAGVRYAKLVAAGSADK